MSELLAISPVVGIWLFLLSLLVIYAAILASLAYWCPQNLVKFQI